MYTNAASTYSGHKLLIEELCDDLGSEDVHLLKEDGFKEIGESPLPVWMMAREAMSKAINDAKFDASSIDLVVFESESTWDNPESELENLGVNIGIRDDFIKAVYGCGITNARVTGIWLSGCANLSVSIDYIQQCFSSGSINSALLVTCSRFVNRRSRALPPYRSSRMRLHGIAGDAATAALFVDNIAIKYGPIARHVSTVVSSNLLMRKAYEDVISGASDLHYIVELTRLIQRARNKFIKSLHIDLFELEHIIFGNYIKSEIALYIKFLGIADKEICMVSKAHLGHCVSSDTLVSLGMKLKSYSQGDRVGLVSIGPFSIGISVFEIEV